MAAALAEGPLAPFNNGIHHDTPSADDLFSGGNPSQQSYLHRFSPRLPLESSELSGTSSPLQVKRTIEAHLQETNRRLLDTQRLGTSLLKQQEELSNQLHEVEQHRDEAEIPDDLRKRLADIEREHNDVGREVARALIAPKQRTDDAQAADADVYAANPTPSPTKVSAPTRRQRNQPSSRAGDLQFAADISTSLLAQVRQLQAAVAERDETLKQSVAERERLEHDVLATTQRLRVLDESEQRYKDENWNLETQNHELQLGAKESGDREKRLGAVLGTVTSERSRLQSDLDEMRMALEKLSEEHAVARKAHDTEVHGLKRSADAADAERTALQTRIDELVGQNQELARAVATNYRSQQLAHEGVGDQDAETASRDVDLYDDSPPPSPTKGTPRHGGLESETLRSSLHHAHRMIQNLKGNIHREKTEKIELKRMLQEARDELESRRDSTGGSASKRQKTRPDNFKKPARPDMLGGSRRPRTEVELSEEDWEDHVGGAVAAPVASRHTFGPRTSARPVTDTGDAYQTANDTESAFETADERHATESEAFMTGVESLGGDSSEDLTETEDTASRHQRSSTIRAPRASLAAKQAGDRTSYLSTASTSASEEEDLRTPINQSMARPRFRSSKIASARSSREAQESTPDSFASRGTPIDSPTTVMSDRSPPAGEQSLFAELGGMSSVGSDRFSTPARSSIASHDSTPAVDSTPSKTAAPNIASVVPDRVPMVDSSTMTEPWEPTPIVPTPAASAATAIDASEVAGSAPPTPSPRTPSRALSPSGFPLPPSVPASPVRVTDSGTQYTPRRDHVDGPVRSSTDFATPTKPAWNETQGTSTPRQEGPLPVEATPPNRSMAYSYVVSQDTMPSLLDSPTLGFSNIVVQDSEPISPPPPVGSTRATADPEGDRTPQKGSTGIYVGAAPGGVLASATAALGLSKARKGYEIQVAEDASSQSLSAHHETTSPARQPLADISGNERLSRPGTRYRAEPEKNVVPVTVPGTDQGSQTELTAEQIEVALTAQKEPPVPVLAPTGGEQQRPAAPGTTSDAQSSTRGLEVVPVAETNTAVIQPSTIYRPASSSSNRGSSSTSQQHPPLPTDHKDMIARANSQIGSPTRRDNHALKVGSVMGPPAVPASAMRRPKTPSESIRSNGRDSRYSQPGRHNRHEPALASQVSRRSSMSSFASELDDRFNIRPDHPSTSHPFEAGPGTDPRMIQAITQTMIGEFLWKYTRKHGSKEMSNTRHKRYFWVHPYTKTLYWSDQDPQTAGRSELKAKSVAIESVRVVSDDNPMPPGLHRKSLEVTTPGRKVKFTASTGQRHETWFNALSYLLLRTDPLDANAGMMTSGAGNELTRDDVNEFNANGYGARLMPGASRNSMSSYNSRTTHGTAHRVSNGNRAALPAGVTTSAGTSQRLGSATDRTGSVPGPVDNMRHSRADRSQESDKDRTVRAGSVSRFSRMIGSVSGKSHPETPQVVPSSATQHRVAKNEGGSIYDASVVSADRPDSQEEMRRDMLRQEQEGLGGLENVRACCDGKHDVSTLNHRHGSVIGSKPPGRISTAINRSMSRKS